jgi:hypothetical protein
MGTNCGSADVLLAPPAGSKRIDLQRLHRVIHDLHPVELEIGYLGAPIPPDLIPRVDIGDFPVIDESCDDDLQPARGPACHSLL